MADMHSKMIEAVVHAAEVVKNLSERPQNEDKKGKSKVASGNTVEKPLPTL